MFRVPAAVNLDAYKNSHRKQYSPNTEVVYSTWTPRKSRLENVDKVVFFGLQYFIKDYLIDSFNETFFNRNREEVLSEIRDYMGNYVNDEDVQHWSDLHDLGYLPLKICALPEGTLTPIRVPMFTIENTRKEFYWITNFIETILSNEIWKPMTSATIALEYRKILNKWAEKTCDNNSHVDYQGHDFSYRGMVGTSGGASSGAGHLLSFKGTDTFPAILFIEQYYNSRNVNGSIGSSIPATEHSVAETNIIETQEMLESGNWSGDIKKSVNELLCGTGFDSRESAEVLYLNRLLHVYKTGFFSYVADTYNIWDVLSDILPILKDKIMSRDGRVVIRPDSGDPVDILCGLDTKSGVYEEEYYLEIKDEPYASERSKGVIELLWDVFGGTVNSKGYKVLDPHIGCIYGDAITLERTEDICKRLEAKGFASSNVVLGIGSYTYNMNTRDTFGFALKTTYGVVNGKELLLYKDPITDDGTKKSQKGMVAVVQVGDSIKYIDELNQANKKELEIGINEYKDLLQPVFEDGKLLKDWTLEEIRDKVKQQINKKEIANV